MSRARDRRKPAGKPETVAPAVSPANAPARVRVVRHRTRTACLLGLLCFAVYLSNVRPMGAWDSVPARMLPFSILRHGDLYLDHFPWLRRLSAHPYFLRETPNGRWLSRYPIGIPIMLTPLYLPANWWLQYHGIEEEDLRFRLASVVMERVSAATLAAATVALVFVAASTIAAPPIAGAVALVFGLGTNAWVTNSQALWQHGGAAFGLAGLSLFVLLPNTRRNAVLAGAFAGLAVQARPTMVVFALLAAVFMWRERRDQLVPFLSLPALGLAFLLAYHVRLVHLLTGGYQRGRFAEPNLWRLLGLLVSPNRGLFIYTPAALLSLPVILRRTVTPARWLTYLAVGLGGYLLLYSAWSGWWGGYCYGPRFFSDVLPAIALCAAPTVERLWQRRAGRVLLAILALWGVLVQGIGVYYDDNSWNALPQTVDSTPRRVWDWRDWQVLRAARVGFHGFDLAPFLWQGLTDPRPVYLKPLEPEELKGGVTIEDRLPLHYHRASSAPLRFRLTNGSSLPWPAYSDFGYLQVWVVYRWWQGGALVNGEGGFISVPRNLGPGDSTDIVTQVDTPPNPGAYEIELITAQALDMTQGRSGDATLRAPVQIE